MNTVSLTPTATERRQASPSCCQRDQGAGRQEAIASDLTYDLRSGDPDFIDQLVALTFGNMAFDAILDEETGLMSAMVNGCYDLVPFPGSQGLCNMLLPCTTPSVTVPFT